jgi:hypothetical protein
MARGDICVILDENSENSSLSESPLIATADFQESASSTELYVRTDAVVSRLVAGETLVLPVRGNVGDLACFYSFNGTGTILWEALEKPKSFKDLCDVIDRKYDVSREQVEQDVALFLGEICSMGLAKPVVDPENEPGSGSDKNVNHKTAPV